VLYPFVWQPLTTLAREVPGVNWHRSNAYYIINY
jgi:hypothetical protein